MGGAALARPGGERGGVVVPALAAAAALVLLVRHAAGYSALFDDFAIFGELPRTALSRILREPLGGFYRPLGLAAMKVEAVLFGLGRPGGIAAVSIALHVANAALLVRLLRQAGHETGTRRAAGALFLASPWAGEAFFWASAQFDLLATFAVLVALSAVFRTTGPGGGRADLLVTAAAGLAALACKESAVPIAAIAFLVVLSHGRSTGLEARRLAPPVLGLLLLTLLFLWGRSLLLPSLRGPYGEFATLVSGGAWLRNLRSHADAFLRPAFGPSGAALVVLQATWAGALLLLLLRAARRDLAGTALRLLALLASLAPVVTIPTGAASIPGGRLLYLPGALLVLLLAGAPAGEVRRPAAAAATAALALALFSLSEQQALWRAASALARRVVAALEPWAVPGRPLYVLNLPLGFEGGPYLLKSYAFRNAFPDRAVPPVRAEGVVLARDPDRLRVVRSERDPFSEGAPAPGDRRLRLLLDDSWLR